MSFGFAVCCFVVYCLLLGLQKFWFCFFAALLVEGVEWFAVLRNKLREPLLLCRCFQCSASSMSLFCDVIVVVAVVVVVVLSLLMLLLLLTLLLMFLPRLPVFCKALVEATMSAM